MLWIVHVKMIYVYIYVHKYMCICVLIHVFIHIDMHIYTYMETHIYISLQMYLYPFTCKCINTRDLNHPRLVDLTCACIYLFLRLLIFDRIYDSLPFFSYLYSISLTLITTEKENFYLIHNLI
jgi:hypothetical protein